MRVLLCDAKTGLFYQPTDQWTREPELAENFRSSYKAALFAQEHGLEHAEVLLDFNDPEYNVRLPIGARLGLNYPVDRKAAGPSPASALEPSASEGRNIQTLEFT